ncbi:MAG TPA: hypothetical protein DIU00_13250 [Phycisphaerales bacterium]|jgi:hypothetical protein|nr:hypothetical protein [Phycisphaerales bacterium]
MTTKQDAKNKLGVMRVVTNICISGGKLKAEYAEVTFTGEVEVKKLNDKYFSVHQDGRGLRFR